MAGPHEPAPQRPENQGEPPGDRQPPTPSVGGGSGGFHRERFLLRLVAVILIAEVMLFTAATLGCAVMAQQRPLNEKSFCSRADRSLEAAFGVALNTLLALLGGKAASDSLR